MVEECPSSQPELYQRIPIRVPFGFLSTANGCLGFGLSGSIGLRMGLPDRPVVAVLGDGSTMYAIQALWSAARYDVGVLLIVLANGRYAVMDALARRQGGAGAWPGFEAVDIGGLARSLGCPSVRVETHEELLGSSTRSLAGLGRAARAAAARSGGGGVGGDRDRLDQDHAGGHHRRARGPASRAAPIRACAS